MENLIKQKHYLNQIKYSELNSKLDALSPLKTLSRGYSIIEKDNKIVKSKEDIKKGDEISLKFKDGEAKAKVI